MTQDELTMVKTGAGQVAYVRERDMGERFTSSADAV